MQVQTAQQELADHLLIEQVYSGDYLAFETLVERYQRSLYRYIRGYIGSDDAQDVLQFVWCQLYLSMPELYQKQAAGWRHVSIKPWLFRTALNRCIDEQRKRKRHPWLFFSELETFLEDDGSSILTTFLDTTPLPEEYAERNEDQNRLYTAIQALPDKFRNVVWLRLTEEMNFTAIGRKLNIPPSTAKTYYYRACTKLRTVLSICTERTAVS